LGPKLLKKSDKISKISRSENPKALFFLRGTTRPNYLHAQKKK
jgi:hypothetical protein